MKKRTVFFIGAVVGCALMFGAFKVVLPYFHKSALKNSWKEVTAKLDSGGELYGYVYTERFLHSFDGILEKIARLASTNKGSDSQITARIPGAIRQLLTDIGINEISGIGFSSIAIRPDLFRTRFVLHHYPQKGKGLIWNMSDKNPPALDQLRLLPSHTVAAHFNDFPIQKIWEWLLKETAAINIPEATSALRSLAPLLKAQGIDWPKLLQSFGGRAGFLLTLDPQKRFSLPESNPTVYIPEPAVAVVFSVKDSTLFDLVARLLPMAKKEEVKGQKKLQFPALSMPFPVEPVIIQREEWLIVASQPQLVESMFDDKSNIQRLTDSDEYKKLSHRLPDHGSEFVFLSSRLFAEIREIQKKALASSATSATTDAMGPLTQEILDIFNQDLALCGVRQNTGEGTVITVNHTGDPITIMALPATAAAGIAAAVAIPNLISSSKKAKAKATMADIRSISMALECYLTDTTTLPEGETLKDLQQKLVPLYIKQLPLKDAWGNDILFTRGASPESYKLASCGSDGIFKGWEQKGSYDLNLPADRANDIILIDGVFVFSPQTR